MARNLKTQNTLNKLKKKSPYASLTDVVNDLNVLGAELDSSVKVTSSAQRVIPTLGGGGCIAGAGCKRISRNRGHEIELRSSHGSREKLADSAASRLTLDREGISRRNPSDGRKWRLQVPNCRRQLRLLVSRYPCYVAAG